MSKRAIGSFMSDDKIFVVLDDGSCYVGYEVGGKLMWRSEAAVPGTFAYMWPQLAEPHAPMVSRAPLGNDPNAMRAS